jgi:hypothetical protein
MKPLPRLGVVHRKYNSRRAKRLSEIGRRRALKRWKIYYEKQDAEMAARARDIILAEAAYPTICDGDAIGSFEYRDFLTGTVKRWTVLRGRRRDQIRLRHPDGRRTRSSGWAWVFTELRKWICSRCGQAA